MSYDTTGLIGREVKRVFPAAGTLSDECYTIIATVEDLCGGIHVYLTSAKGRTLKVDLKDCKFTKVWDEEVFLFVDVEE